MKTKNTKTHSIVNATVKINRFSFNSALYFNDLFNASQQPIYFIIKKQRVFPSLTASMIVLMLDLYWCCHIIHFPFEYGWVSLHRAKEHFCKISASLM